MDEIVVLDISGASGLREANLREIERAEVRTPLAYGGGIRNVKDALLLASIGCERLVLKGLLDSGPHRVRELIDAVGRQAIVASVPFSMVESLALAHPSRGSTANVPLAERIRVLRSEFHISEFLVGSRDAQGTAGRFPVQVADDLEDASPHSIIWFGGLNPQIAAALCGRSETAGVAFGTRLHEKELEGLHLRTEIRSYGSADVLRTVRPTP